MARTKPYDIIERHAYSNHSVKEIGGMLEHYGFIKYFTGGTHVHFKHREYADMGHFGHSGGVSEASRGFVETACFACMEVKRRNAERKKPKAEEIPVNITDDLFTGFDVDHDHGVIRLKPHDISFNSPDRTYEIAADHGLLTIKSLSFSEYAVSVPLKLAAERAEDVISTFKTLDDGSVIPHIQEREQRFHAALADLESSAGCRINKVDDKITAVWQLEFSSGIQPLTILAPKAGKVIANETIAAVDALTDKVLEQAAKCEAMLAGLQQKGWVLKPNGAANYIKLSHSAANGNGEAHAVEVQIPVSGELGLFNENLMQLRTDKALGKSDVEATPTSQITEPAHVRVKAVNHR